MERLIKEYQRKIDGYDDEIKELTKFIRIERQSPNSHFLSKEELVEERKIVDTKRMLLVQVVKDLEDYK